MSKLHCWKDEAEYLAEIYGGESDQYFDHMASDKPSRTCLLQSGHDGPHVWTDDEEIVVRFK